MSLSVVVMTEEQIIVLLRVWQQEADAKQAELRAEIDRLEKENTDLKTFQFVDGEAVTLDLLNTPVGYAGVERPIACSRCRQKYGILLFKRTHGHRGSDPRNMLPPCRCYERDLCSTLCPPANGS